jgi:hypothetical protein
MTVVDETVLDSAPEPTLGQLVASASRDVSTLVNQEIALAKAEIAGSMKSAGMGTGMFAGAAFFGLFAFGFLLTAAAWGLVAAGLSQWLANLIVALVLLLLAGILALVGKKALGHANPTPTRAIAAAQETIATFKKG